MFGDGAIEQSSQEQGSKEISKEKKASLRASFEKARPKIRELLGIPESKPDTFFLGLYGSTVKEKANKDSDVDAYLFYITDENTPTIAANPYLNYDLSQTFDSPAKSLFGYPKDRKPPNPNGKEDVEAHDITKLVTQIAESGPLEAGLVSNKLQEVAIIFSPEVIGDPGLIENIRQQILEAMKKRTGKPFDQQKFQKLWDSGYGPLRGTPRDYHPPFEASQMDGITTWQLVGEEYLKLFKKPFEVKLVGK